MAYDDDKVTGETIASDDWDEMVALIKTDAIPIVTFADGDATPSVAGVSAGLISGAKTFKTANTGATQITNFIGGTEGQLVTVMAGDGFTEIVPNGSIKCNAGSTLTLGQYDTVSFRLIDGIWVCIGYQQNSV